KPVSTSDAFATSPDSGTFTRGTRIYHFIVLTTAFRTAHGIQTTANSGFRTSTILFVGVSSLAASYCAKSKLRLTFPLPPSTLIFATAICSSYCQLVWITGHGVIQ